MVSKVIKVESESLSFDSGHDLYSWHERDCCEQHYLCFEHVSIKDFDGLQFDLDGEFFERVEGYGIRLIPINGFPVSIPGYGYNNGYYSSEMTLNLKIGDDVKTFDISDCQEIEG